MSSNSPLSGKQIEGFFVPAQSGSPASENLELREEIGALLKSILQRIVKNPDDVQISYFEGEKTTVYNIAVHPGDYGFLLGKSGTTINSLRAIIRAMMARHQIRVVLEAPNTPRPVSAE